MEKYYPDCKDFEKSYTCYVHLKNFNPQPEANGNPFYVHKDDSGKEHKLECERLTGKLRDVYSCSMTAMDIETLKSQKHREASALAINVRPGQLIQPTEVPLKTEQRYFPPTPGANASPGANSTSRTAQ